jgi:hypothetical protein
MPSPGEGERENIKRKALYAYKKSIAKLLCIDK